MGFQSSIAGNNANGQQQTTMKRVRFKPYASLIKVPHPDATAMEEDSDETSSSSSSAWGLWYSKGEMSSLARADVNALLASARHRSSTAAAVADDSDDMDCEPRTEEQRPQVCERGLEMYLPGQLVILRRRRKAYKDAALRKHRALLALCSASKGSEEVAKRLEQFLTIRSRESVDKAHDLGVQDATDAQVIHQESNPTTTNGSSTATFIGNKRKALFPCDEHMATSSKSAMTCTLSPSSSTLMTKQVVLTPSTLFSHQAIQRVA